MGGRDHSYECETCGVYRGGLNDLRCDCDDPHTVTLYDLIAFEAECAERLDTLAANLATAAALCRAFDLGADWNDGVTGDPYNHERYWFHGAGRSAP